ncbi:penicillin-binding transpeptidase domain-containing protein [uncultured Porphyromonas sp.]|uniref:penicillin-binding protein n=1 Tax=uncultured Porphyromonas sp. TaxID=159274 RepID=UPI0025890873|nr:penicillin-binding transpeptidase domain-containing protein [uncultured Porphyromonas sp.]
MTGEDLREKSRQRNSLQRTKRIHKGWELYMKFGLVLLLLGVVVLVKVVITSTVQAKQWEALVRYAGKSRSAIDPLRGNIYSDQDVPVAITVPRYEVALDMGSDSFDGEFFEAGVQELSEGLAEVVGGQSAASYKQGLLRARQKRSKYYRLFGSRELSYTELQALLELPFFKGRSRYRSGLITTKYIRREHPYGNLAFRTIGRIMNEPDSLGMTHGNSGLEMRFDSLLCGKAGVNRWVRVPPRWEPVEEVPATNGMDVYTTLNVDIQDIAEKALRRKLVEVDANWGCVVVMEVATGAVKALSNLDRMGEGVYMERTNHALADLIDPGSTFKAVSMLGVLDRNGVNPQDTVDVGNGIYMIGRGLPIRDHNVSKGGYGKITYNEAIYFSSNVGVVKAVMKTYGNDRQSYLDQFNKMNFFDQIDFEIPGTACPRFKQDVSTWSNSTMPWSAYGYEMGVPPIYTLRFYNAVANGGKMMEPYLVREVSNGEKIGYERSPRVVNKQIASPKAIEQLQEMLRGVVTEGTGKAMDSPYVSISGKTGTAQRNVNGSFKGTGHNVTFCGYFPSERPLYSCIVVVSRPRGVYPSGSIPGAVLREIAEKTIATSYTQSLGEVLPDSLATFGQRVLGGTTEGVKHAIKYTGAKVDQLHSSGTEWLSHQGGDSLQILSALKPEVGTMPDLMGMSVMDALYLAEKMGLDVRLNGQGGVVKQQSIHKGGRTKQGQLLILTLRNE